MDKRIIGFLPSAAFYVPALAAQVSGYTSSTVALVLAVIATVMLLVPACHHGSQWHQSRKSSARNGLDSWYFIAPCLVIGVVAFALAAYGLGLRSGTTVQVTNNNDLTAASPPLKEAVTDPSDIPRKIAVIDDARKLLRTEMEPAMNDGMRMFQSGQDALRKGDRNPLMKGLAEYFQTWAALWKKLEDFKKANDGFEDINSILDQTYRTKLETGFSSLQGAVGSFGDAPYKFDMNFFFEPHANAFREGMAEWARWEQDADRKLLALRKSFSK